MKRPSTMLTALLSMGMLYQLTNSTSITFADLDMSPTGLSSNTYTERANVFTGKMMPAKYTNLNMTVTKPCQCKNMCFVKTNCASATFLDVANTDENRCLISEAHFSHLELISPTADISSALTFYWFKNDYVWDNGFRKVHGGIATFSEAQSTCKSEGGQLVTLETEAKYQDVITKLQAGNGAYYWIGLKRDIVAELPEWQRTTGNIVATSSRIPGGGTENCYSLSYNSGWAIVNMNCDNKYSLVCERNF